jgi:hypothetical protein
LVLDYARELGFLHETTEACFGICILVEEARQSVLERCGICEEPPPEPIVLIGMCQAIRVARVGEPKENGLELIPEGLVPVSSLEDPAKPVLDRDLSFTLFGFE